MAKAAFDGMSEENALFMNHFPVGKRRFMRYAAQRSPQIPGKGTIILLSEWGTPVEANNKIISALNKRGFHIVTYDWYARSSSKADYQSQYETAFRFNQGNLHALLHKVVLPDFPGPFYIFAQGTGGLFALTAHDILRDLVRRMVILSPLLEARGHHANGFYHQYIRVRSIFSLLPDQKRDKRTKTALPFSEDSTQKASFIRQIARPTPQWYKTVLNAAAYVLSPAYCRHMAIPTLFIISTRDQRSDPRITRELGNRLRMAESITITGAGHDILNDRSCYRTRFWKAFDTFIPGTGTPVFREPTLQPVTV